MSDINTITIVGRLTNDAQSVNCEKGGAKFSVANHGWKENDTTFFSCTMFGERGVKCIEWLKKGKQVCVCGRMQCNKRDNREFWGITVNDVQPIGMPTQAELGDSKAKSEVYYSTNPRFRDYDHPNADLVSDITDQFNGTPETFEDTGDIPF